LVQIGFGERFINMSKFDINLSRQRISSTIHTKIPNIRKCILTGQKNNTRFMGPKKNGHGTTIYSPKFTSKMPLRVCIQICERYLFQYRDTNFQPRNFRKQTPQAQIRVQCMLQEKACLRAIDPYGSQIEK